MNTLITYDINRKHGEVKSAMIKNHYMKSWTDNGTTYYLPNTTLWKQNVTPATAVADLRSVIQAINNHSSANEQIKLERAIAVEFTNQGGIPGDPN